jgi:hypothetical protein
MRRQPKYRVQKSSLHSQQAQGRAMSSIETLFRENLRHVIGVRALRRGPGRLMALLEARHPTSFAFRKSDDQTRRCDLTCNVDK